MESTLQLAAVPLDAAGNAIGGRRVFWASEDASIARVSETGEVTGLQPGSTRVAASVEGMSGVTTVTVLPKAVVRVTVTPERLTLVAGESGSVAATALDRSGKPIEERGVVWASGDPNVATVDGSGRVDAVAEGSTVVRATVEGVSGEAAVVVTRKPVATVAVSPETASLIVGESTQLTATARASDGSVLEGRETLWSSSDADVAMVTDAGVVVAAAPGRAVVSALVEGQAGSATVTVGPKPIATLEISPTSAQLTVRGTQQFTATAKAADGSVLTGRSFAWSVANPGVATVDANGLATAVAVGQTTVTASSEGKHAVATLIVSPVPVAAVEVVPSTLQILVGATQQLRAVARDASGAELVGRATSWSSSASSVASVSPSGVVTGVAPGEATITASVEGRTGSASVTVAPVPVSTVEVSPTSSELPVGGTVQLEATLHGSNGAPLTERTVTWSSNAPAVASVTPGGLVTAHAAGQATITAASEGKSGSASVTVLPPPPAPVATVEVSPATVQLLVGGSGQLTATLEAADGTVLSGRTVTWSSSAPEVASVSADGLVNAHAAGEATVTATSEGKSGSASVTVTAPPPPVATVEVSPGGLQLLVGGSGQLTATVKAVDGTVLTGRTVTWSSSAPAVASVSSEGVVSAHAAGQATVTATSEGKSGSASVTVTAPAPEPVATVEVSPSSLQLVVGGGGQLLATVKAADGTVLSGRTVTWSSSAPEIASVSTTGAVTARAAGQATVTATSEGKSGGASVTVSAPPPAPVATVAVNPAAVNLRTGESRQLTATLKAADGTVLTDRAVTWTSSNPAVAVVSSTGLVSGLLPGQATVSATSEGKSGSARVTVTLTEEQSAASGAPAARVSVGSSPEIEGSSSAATDVRQASQEERP